ncbi:hypothetical protein D3C81_1130830 [compost metagenome]
MHELSPHGQLLFQLNLNSQNKSYIQKKTTVVVFMHALRTQYFSAFLTTSSENLAAVFRAHSFTETMNLTTFAHIRFESRFHLLHPLKEINHCHIHHFRYSYPQKMPFSI